MTAITAQFVFPGSGASADSVLNAPGTALDKKTVQDWAETIGSTSDDASQAAASASAAATSEKNAAQSSADASSVYAAVVGVQTEVNATAESANNAVSGVTSDANAAKVLLTAAIAGDAPLTYKGYWNASTNSPELKGVTGTDGDLYIVSVAGTTALDGNSSWEVGDGAWFNNGAWQYFARAGWAAFAQTITASRSVTAGETIIESPESSLYISAILGAYGEIVSAFLKDGSPSFGGASAEFAQSLREISDMDGAGIVLIDQFGTVISNNADADFSSSTPAVAAPPIARGVLDRAPGIHDDGDHGYVVGDIWPYRDEIYTCLNATNGGAVWDRSSLAPTPLPGDIAGTSLTGAYGTRRMVSGYTGPLFDVSIANASGTLVVTTIGQNAIGELDRDAYSAALATRQSGNPAFVTKWYDQKGSNDLIGTDTQVHIGEHDLMGYPAVSFNGPLFSTNSYLTASGVSINPQSFGVMLFGRYQCTNTPNDEANVLVGNITIGTGTTRVSNMFGTQEDGLIGLYTGDGKYLSGTTPVITNPTLLGMTSSSATSVSNIVGTNIDEITVASSVLASTTTGLIIGSPIDITTSSAGVLTGLIVTDSTITASEVASYNASAAIRYGFSPQVKPRLYLMGDSRTAGIYVTDGWGWPTIIEEYLDAPMEVRNFAVSGAGTDEQIQYTMPSVVAEIEARGSIPCYAVIWIGTNDFYLRGRTIEHAITNIVTMINDLKAAGATTVFLVSEVNSQPNQAYNAAYASGVFGDVVYIDPFRPGLPITDTSNRTLWRSDSLHPLRPGQRIIARTIADSINSYFWSQS